MVIGLVGLQVAGQTVKLIWFGSLQVWMSTFAELLTKTSWIVNHQLKNYQLTIELFLSCNQARRPPSHCWKESQIEKNRERIQPKICVLDSGCFQDLRCLRCCFDAKPLPTLLHLEPILGQEILKPTSLVNQHGNRKCRIEDVFPIKNGGFPLLVHQSHQRVTQKNSWNFLSKTLKLIGASFSNLVGIHVQTFQDIVAPQCFSHCQSPSFSHQVS